MRYRKSQHSVYNTEYHIVWIPRYRRKLLGGGVKVYLENMLRHLEGLEDDIEVISVNVRVDHVHLVIMIPPRFSVAQVVKYIKSMTGRRLKENFEHMKKAIWGRGGIWSEGYCVSSVGMTESTILEYVEHQGKEDKGQLKIEFGRDGS